MRKRKNVYRLLSLILCLTILMAGCSKKDAADETAGKTVNSTEAPTAAAKDAGTGNTEAADTTAPAEVTNIVMTMYGVNEQASEKEVIDAMNEYSKEKIGVTITYKAFASSDYKDSLSMTLASKEDIDLCWMASYTNFLSLCDQEALMDISSLIPEYKELYGMIPEKIWASTEVNGKNYYIPNYKESFVGYSVWSPETLADTIKSKYGIDFSSIECKNIFEIVNYQDYILACMEEGIEVPLPNGIGYHKWIEADDKYELISSCFIMDKETKKVHFWYDTPEYKELQKTMVKWNELGIWKEEQLMSDFNHKQYIKTGDYALNRESTVPDNVNQAFITYNVPVYVHEATERYLTSDTCIGSGWSINNASQKADACMKWIQLLNTDTTFADMFLYGIENKHYTKDANGCIVKIADSGWSNSAWKTTNFLIPSLLATESPNKKEEYKSANEQSKVTVSLGFRPDWTSIESENAAVLAVFEEHRYLLEFGFENVEDVLQDFVNAGAEKVVNELQSQLDEYLKNK